MKKTLGRILGTLPYLLLLVSFLLVGNVVLALVRGEVPAFFGYSILYIRSGSMEPTIMTGDIILVRRVDADDLAVGDIITFAVAIEEDGVFVPTTVTHRIAAVLPGGDAPAFTTKGDANAVTDPWTVHPEDLVGRYVGRSVVIGNLYRLVTSAGLGLVYVFAIVVFLLIALTEGASLVKAVAEAKKAGIAAERAKLVEEAKAELRAEAHTHNPHPRE